jgi:uncharacterized protein (DUF302 family)
MANMMFKEFKSKYGFEETLVKLGEAVMENNWHVPHILDLQNIYKEHGLKKPKRVSAIAICRPQAAVKILNVDKNKKMAAMMPMQLAVYERKKDEVYISVYNIGFMGKMFGGVVNKEMSKANKDLKKAFKGIIKK